MTEHNDAEHDALAIDRQSFLARTAAVAGALGLGGLLGLPGIAGAATTTAPTNLHGMNVVMFITDQERAIQHFPIGWAQEHMPGMTQLQRHGLTFTNAFTNACMCSPARSTLMSGYFPAQHGVKYTLESNMPSPQYPDQVPLSTSLANIATVMSAAGYNVVYKGKWHCSKPAGAEWTPADLNAFSFNRWNPNDAGADQSFPEMGGGTAQNDARFMGSQTANYTDGNEGALQFINSYAATQQPFFLIVSLVNPHDVLEYPMSLTDAGYDTTWVEGDIGLPATVNEDLSTKPRAQRIFRKLSAGLGALNTGKKKRNYINFYGNLMKSSDAYLVNILSALANQKLLGNTLVIKTADHGEMGVAHGGLRQKNFNFYEETINVPLIYSNPNLYKRPARSDALVSHVDFLPTIANLFSAPRTAQAPWEGVDYSSIVLNPKSKPVQEEIVFTYDDWQSGQASGPYVPAPQHIVSFREKRWKFAEYWDATGDVPSEFEMYDLKTDPLETVNIAHASHDRTPAQDLQFLRLMKKLQTIKSTRLQPL